MGAQDEFRLVSFDDMNGSPNFKESGVTVFPLLQAVTRVGNVSFVSEGHMFPNLSEVFFLQGRFFLDSETLVRCSAE